MTKVSLAAYADPEATKLTPIVMMTSSLDDTIEESYKLGANSYIVKPVDSEKFEGLSLARSQLMRTRVAKPSDHFP